jgi:uncharacterized protein
MQLIWDRDESPLAVDGIEGARIRVGGQWQERSFWVDGRQLGPWRPTMLSEVDETDLHALLEQKPGVILLGTGERHALLPPRLMAVALTRGIGIECMRNDAAARTYNVLLGEQRPVLAAFLVG